MKPPKRVRYEGWAYDEHGEPVYLEKGVYYTRDWDHNEYGDTLYVSTIHGVVGIADADIERATAKE